MTLDPFTRDRTFTEFDTPFDDGEALAAWLISEENDAPIFCALRQKFALIIRYAPPEARAIWSKANTNAIRCMPEARGLFPQDDGTADSAHVALAWAILDHAVELMRLKS